jgi:septal ring factor EnvC (AmiA/AmiB activator)
MASAIASPGKISVTLGLLLCFILSLPAGVLAEKADDAKKKYQKVQEDIKDKQKNIKESRKLESSTLKELDKTNMQLQKVSEKLNKYRRQIRGTKKNVQKVEAEVADLREKIKKRKEWMRRKLRAMHRYGRYGDIIMILGASEGLSQLLRRWRYLEVLTSYEREAIEEYRKDLKALKRKQEKLDALYARLDKEAERVNAEKKNLMKAKEKKRQILASVRQKRVSYEKMLKDLLTSSRKLREIIRESERKKRYAGKGFRNLKGRLPWPVSGKVAVPYGTTEDPRFKTPVFRNGIYIATHESALAVAVHKGEVVFADWFKGYGQLVVLNHGEGYHSLYANLSEIFLKQGDIIESKGRIGKVGESGMLNRSSLYFEIRYKGKALNPTQWLHGKGN